MAIDLSEFFNSKKRVPIPSGSSLMEDGVYSGSYISISLYIYNTTLIYTPPSEFQKYSSISKIFPIH
jgi:hypothetical protein